MNSFAKLCAAITMAVVFAGCNQGGANGAANNQDPSSNSSNQGASNHDADVKAIQDDEAQWNQDFQSKDTNKLLAHYTDDAVLMASGMPASSGKAAIGNVLKQMVSDPALSLKFQASKVEVAKSGDVAYTQGSYSMTMTNPQNKQVMHDHGSYVTTYRKQPDGSWKAVADIATSEAAPPEPSSRSSHKHS